MEQQRQKDDNLITRMKALLTLMEKYVAKEPEITVREVCEREQDR